MSWSNEQRDDLELHCVYCNTRGAFPHFASYEFFNSAFHLHRCPVCRSLIYDPRAMGPLFGKSQDESGSLMGTKYYFESAYSAFFTVRCALSAIPELPLEELKNYNFLDIGAGNGLGSYIVRELFDINVQAVEPSLTGEAAKRLFGLPVERKYFEEIDESLLKKLRSKPCLVHLDAVIEHLNNPRNLLKELVSNLDIEVLSALVPDGATVSKADPFTVSVQILSPCDHVHLPTPEGMDKLFADLGFPFRHVFKHSKLFIMIGSKKPVSPPSDQRVQIATDLTLERLAQHQDPSVSHGAAARMLIDAIGKRKLARIDYLKSRFFSDFRPEIILDKLKSKRPWDEIPFYSGALAYWLAVDLAYNNRWEEAFPYLDVTETYAARLTREYPQLAMEAQLYKWEGRMFRAHILKIFERLEEAQDLLQSVVDSTSDRFAPASDEVITRARHALAELSASQAAA